ncbi:MAG: YiiD C-terminal domain-containing protein [Pirellulales bacterium]|nr:YiiD C-terminal domain-containing protein [Pirellulales bacterium]
MKVTDIPFNAFLKIEEAPADSSYLLQLQESPSHLNHVGTVHAGVQLALAEAASGQYLMQALPELADKVVGVVRRVEAKFKKPMQGAIFSRAITPLDEIQNAAEQLAAKGRRLIPVTVEIIDRSDNVGLVATFEWFAAKRE